MKSLIQILLILAIFMSNARAETDSSDSQIEAWKAKAVGMASHVFNSMKLPHADEYIIIPFDKNNESLLNDSDIAPYVSPIAIENDYWIVLMIPQDPNIGPGLCVYVDKRLNVVRGYILDTPKSRRDQVEPEGELND